VRFRYSVVIVNQEANGHRLAVLRAEIDRICAENRGYFSRRLHSELEKMAHERRRMQVVEIKAELASMLKGTRGT
jgi:hypothetical protein